MSYSRPTFPEDHYTRIPNAWIRDGNLRPNAKAILFTIMSHDADYKLSVAQVMRETGLGRDAISAATDHMLERGYLMAVTQRIGERGRFGENHYIVTDCTGIPNPQDSTANPEVSGRNVRIAPQRSNTATVPDRSGAIPPLRRTTTTEEQLDPEEQLPLPQAEGARHLAAVETPAQRIAAAAQELTKEHYDASGGLAKFPAVLAIVKRALSATRDDGSPWYTVDDLRGALKLLRDAGRPVTLETVRAALTTPGAVSSRGYGPRQHVPYRDPDPSTPNAFTEGF